MEAPRCNAGCVIPLIINRHHREREKRMTKAKTKPRATAPTGDGPTAERMTRDTWETIAAPKLGNEDWQTRNASARKQACRIGLMVKWGWIDGDEAQAIVNYQGMIETAGYDRGRSCLDFTPYGNGKGLPPAVVRARDALAPLDLAISFEIGQDALGFVRAVLGPYGMETVGDVAERWQPAYGRDKRMTWARDVFAALGELLHQTEVDKRRGLSV
jgi:hypothetical protein